jgi:hypothetical protein
MECIKYRTTIEYELNELDIIQTEKSILSQQIDLNSKRGINIIYDNQKTCGKAVRNIFNNKSIINCLVYGMTQTGKTGCMTALIQYYILSNNIPINNIYIITGLSDAEWKKDTKNRMPDAITSRVFHRANLSKTFLEDITNKKNVLVIMDEIQIACDEDQTIHKTFEKCGFYNLDYLLENDIKLIQFSATPDGNLSDMQDWGPYSAKVKLEPGENYYGPKQAIEQNRVKQFKDLKNIDNVEELKQDIINFDYSNPRYHLIRVPNKKKNKDGTNNQNKVISNIKKVFGDNCEYKYPLIDRKIKLPKIDKKTGLPMENKKGDINDILIKQPKKHTFIFICEKYRCAKTIDEKKFIGILYERYISNPNDSSIIQGSFGRLTGYNDNGDSICYTNIPSIENYIKLWENNMEYKKGIIWNTNTTLYNKKDDITYSTGTFNSVKHIEQLKDGCSEKVKEDREEPTIKKFGHMKGADGPDFKSLKDYVKTKLNKKRGPNTLKENNGFYESNIRGIKKVYSTEEIYKERKCNIENGAGYGIRPCYSDVTDPNTLEWWLIYYEN